jgi:protoheme IX farnesyltransferase
MSLSETRQKSTLRNKSAGPTGTAVSPWRSRLQTIVILFKLRIVFLLLMAATGGAFLAAGGWPGFGNLLLLWLTGGMAAAGASALNQYWERESDGDMMRTRKRPLVTGVITKPAWVPYVGIGLVLLPSLVMLPFNPALTFFLLLGAFIYVVIYTIWLKPRTLINIVIGGAAGSAAVLSGSAAVGSWSNPGALVLSLLLFLWTPFHFWSLALLYKDDYARSDMPMLPVHTTPRQAAWWVMSHTLPAGLGGLLLAVLPILGWVYLIPVIWITVDLFWRNVRLIQTPSPENAKKLFMSSNIYLLVLLLAICAGTVASSVAG